MDKYKILKQKNFENMEKFEKRMNEHASQGWKVGGFTRDHGSFAVLLERDR